MKIKQLKGFSVLLFLLFCSYTYGQEISGTVSDSNGPLPGANVIVKGTSNGTTTNFDGNFTLTNVPTNSILVVSYVGYATQEVELNGKTNISIVLIEDANSLEEIVVVGYGAKKKSLVTGAISSIKSEDVSNNATTRVEQAMQGKVAGISVLSNSGSPGSASKIRIRGTGSNGNADPIYIVDGMKTYSIDNIDAGDIESIEVLKDAASSAIYGTEGANGVVIVTTKSGKNYDHPVISYNSQFGVQSERTKMDLMNESQYRTYLNEAGVANISSNGINTDWLGEVFEDAWMEKHHISFAGGSEKSTYLVSASYTNQDGIVGGDQANFKRYTARLNSKHQINNWLEIGNNLTYSNTARSVIDEDDEYRGILNNAILMDPLTPVLYDGTPSNVSDLLASGQTILSNRNGQYYGLPAYVTGEIANPIAMLSIQNRELKTDKILGTFFANITPIENLTLTTRLGIDINYVTEHNWNPVYYVSSERQNSLATVDDNITKNTSWLFENFATYKNSYEKHDYTFLLGMSAEKYQSPNWYLFSGPMPKEGDNYPYHDYTQDDDLDKVGGNFIERKKTSIFGRFSYEFDEKYLLEGTLRYDESSAFSDENKGAIFPSISAGWIVSSEDFWKADSKIDYLKFRASWGQVGSDQNLLGNEALQFFTSEGIKIPDGNGGFLNGYEAAAIPNPDLTWETSEQLDLGIDLRAFDGKLKFSTDYFDKKTKDLIVSGNSLIPLSVGREYGNFNGGTVSNKGFEFELGYNDKVGDFKYSVNFNLSTLKNEVTELNIDAPIDGVSVRGFDGTTRFEEGEPIWYFRGYKTDGIDPATGEVNVVDVDGSGDITPNDITNIGDPHPDLLYGGQISVGYKDFDLNVNFQGTHGNEIYMMWNRTDRIYSNKPTFLYDNRWTAPGDNASYPKADVSSDHLYRSDLMVGDGSYMRIKQIQFGYSLPKTLLEKINIDRLRLFVSLEDYFTFTKYEGLDPEAGSSNNLSQGIDRGVYPIPGKVIFGLSVNL